MTFTTGFLSFLIHAALIWCAISSAALLGMLARDLLRGSTW